MSQRWSDKETEALAELREILKDDLASRPQYPDVVGDRRLLRFLRGKQNNVAEAAKMFSAFLKWRDENNVDDIRNQILYGGLDTPYKFPNGKKIIDLAPQIIISSKAQDFKGQPLVLEQYSFSPGDMFARVTVKDYLIFLVYALEYRALVMEQMSHEREQKYLAEHPNPDDRADEYGVILLNFCIRDLQGVGLSHLTGKGKQIIEAAINIGLPNYPEYLGKCHMINVPWVFTSMWFFIKGLLDDFILAKINLTGSKYMDTLLKDMPIESIPKALGGKFELYNESYSFDTSPTGPFYTEPILKLPRGASGNSLNNIAAAPAATLMVMPPPRSTSPVVQATGAVGTELDDGAEAVGAQRQQQQAQQQAQQQRGAGAEVRQLATAGAAARATHTNTSATSNTVSAGPALTRQALDALTPPTQRQEGTNKSLLKHTSWSSVQSTGAYGNTTTQTISKPAQTRTPTIKEMVTTPVGLSGTAIFGLILLAYPMPMFKYVIVPVLFALFVVYVI